MFKYIIKKNQPYNMPLYQLARGGSFEPGFDPFWWDVTKKFKKRKKDLLRPSGRDIIR
jgi:hypothetical protein